MSLKGESHKACLGGRVGGACNFMVNVMIIDRFESSILFFSIFMDGKGLEMFCKIFEEFSKMTSMG